jgi:hypothetical protein
LKYPVAVVYSSTFGLSVMIMVLRDDVGCRCSSRNAMARFQPPWHSVDGIVVSFLTLQDIHNCIFMDFITISRNKGAEEAILLLRLPQNPPMRPPNGVHQTQCNVISFELHCMCSPWMSIGVHCPISERERIVLQNLLP